MHFCQNVVKQNFSHRKLFPGALWNIQEDFAKLCKPLENRGLWYSLCVSMHYCHFVPTVKHGGGSIRDFCCFPLSCSCFMHINTILRSHLAFFFITYSGLCAISLDRMCLCINMIQKKRNHIL